MFQNVKKEILKYKVRVRGINEGSTIGSEIVE